MSRVSVNFAFKSIVVLFLILAAASRTTFEAQAATITVNSTSGVVSPSDGLCTLREAIIAANTDADSGANPGECSAGSGSDVIELGFGTYTMTAADNYWYGSTVLPAITSTVTIEGGGAIIDGSSNGRIFYVSGAGNLTLRNLTLQNGLAQGGRGGDGVGGGGGVVWAVRSSIKET